MPQTSIIAPSRLVLTSASWARVAENLARANGVVKSGSLNPASSCICIFFNYGPGQAVIESLPPVILPCCSPVVLLSLLEKIN